MKIFGVDERRELISTILDEKGRECGSGRWFDVSKFSNSRSIAEVGARAVTYGRIEATEDDGIVADHELWVREMVASTTWSRWLAE
jgi:hypothetical protein